MRQRCGTAHGRVALHAASIGGVAVLIGSLPKQHLARLMA